MRPEFEDPVRSEGETGGCDDPKSALCDIGRTFRKNLPSLNSTKLFFICSETKGNQNLRQSREAKETSNRRIFREHSLRYLAVFAEGPDSRQGGKSSENILFLSRSEFHFYCLWRNTRWE